MGDAPIVIAGCGSIGARHARNLRELTQADLLFVDADPRRAETLAGEIRGRAYATLGEALGESPAAAFICTPTDLHLEGALAAARAGCDLFIEKPLGHRLDGVEEIERAVASTGLLTMVGCNMRFHPGPAAIKRSIDQGDIGDVLAARVHTGSYLPSWRPAQDFRRAYSASTGAGGAILDCVHEIDLAQWYLGPGDLHAALVQPARTLGLATDGLAELLLTHSGGRISSVHLNFVQRDYSRSCLIIGSNGSLEWSWREGKVTLFDETGQRAREEAQDADWSVNQMYLDELRHFLAAAAARFPPMNGISEAARTLRIALKARSRPESATRALQS